MEIFRRAQLMGKKDFKNLEALVVAALLYWGLTTIFSFFQARLEKRMSKGYVRASAESPKLLPGSAAGGYGSGAMEVEIDDAPEGVGPP